MMVLLFRMIGKCGTEKMGEIACEAQALVANFQEIGKLHSPLAGTQGTDPARVQFTPRTKCSDAMLTAIVRG